MLTSAIILKLWDNGVSTGFEFKVSRPFAL